MMKFRICYLSIVISFLLASCGKKAPSITPSIPTSPPGQIQIATDTSLPPTPTSYSYPASTVMPMPESTESWELVAFGDSHAWGFFKYYAAFIEADLGVDVRVYDQTITTQSALMILEKLKTDETLREIVGGAEFITYMGNPRGVLPDDSFSCNYEPHYINDCSFELFDNYIATWEEFLDEVLALQEGRPAAIRAMNYYASTWRWQDEQIYAECIVCLENMNSALEQVAAAYDIPFANVFEAFNGPDHNENPREKGYISGDAAHTSAMGQRVIADVFRNLGYEPLGSAEILESTVAETWDYVVIGDDNMWDYFKFYAGYLVGDLGVDVLVHEKTFPNMGAVGLLRNLRNKAEFRELVKNAEVLTFLVSTEGSELDPDFEYGDCKRGTKEPGGASLIEYIDSYENYRMDLASMLEEILSLRDGVQTLIRVMDYPIYSLDQWEEWGMLEGCQRNIEALNTIIHQTAEEYGIPVVPVYDLFNGPNHDHDARGYGYVRPDGRRILIEGEHAIARLLRAMGYELMLP